jgi:mannosyltransferase
MALSSGRTSVINPPLREPRPASRSRSALDRTRTPLGAALLVGVLGLIIALIGIGVPSVWYDESATIISSTRTWSQLFDMLGTVDAVHGLYYAMMHLVFDVFGYSPFTLRVPSAISVGAAGVFTVLLGNELFRLRVAVLAGIVFVLLPRTMWMGTEGRSYALTATLAVALTLVLVRALRSPSRRRWITYGVLVVLSCLVFLYLALIVVAHAVAMAAYFARRRREVIPVIRSWAITTAVATALVIPFALATMGQSKQLHWLDPLGHHTLRQVFVGQWFYTSAPFAYVGWALIVIGAVVLLVRLRRDPLPAALLLALLIVPTLALLAVTEFYLPIYTPRYLSMGLPFVAVIMAVALSTITDFRWMSFAERRATPLAEPRATPLTRPRATALATGLATALACALLVALAVPQFLAQREPQSKENTSWSQVAESIAEARAADGPDVTTAIVYGGVQFHPIATARVIAYSYPDAFADTIDVTLDTPAAETGRLWETTRPLSDSLDRLDGADVVYIVASFARDIRTDATEILLDEGWVVDDSWDLTDVHVVRFVRN